MHVLMKLLFGITVLAAMLPGNAAAAPAKPTAAKALPLSQSYTWYDGDRERKVWLNPQLVAEFNPGAQGERSVRSTYTAAQTIPTKRGQGGVRLWKLNEAGKANETAKPNDTATTAIRNLKAIYPQGRYSAILHDGPSDAGRMRALPGNIIVYLNPQWDEAAVKSWLSSHQLAIVKKLEIGPNIYVIKTGPGLEALTIANTLYRSGEVQAAFPDWWQEVATR